MTVAGSVSGTASDDRQVADDGGYTVDVSGNSDGSVSVRNGAIEFTAPIEMTWRFQGFNDGYRGTADEAASASTATPVGPPLEVRPTLDPTDDAQYAFATPTYDADADRLEC